MTADRAGTLAAWLCIAAWLLVAGSVIVQTIRDRIRPMPQIQTMTTPAGTLDPIDPTPPK